MALNPFALKLPVITRRRYPIVAYSLEPESLRDNKSTMFGGVSRMHEPAPLTRRMALELIGCICLRGYYRYDASKKSRQEDKRVPRNSSFRENCLPKCEVYLSRRHAKSPLANFTLSRPTKIRRLPSVSSLLIIYFIALCCLIRH